MRDVMNNDFNNLINIYQNVLDLTIAIIKLLENQQTEEIELVLEQRGVFIRQIQEITQNKTFSNEEKAQINAFVDKIKQVEAKSVEEIKSKQENIQKELSTLKVGQKALGAYKFHKQYDPRLVDSVDCVE
ncbi:MAG: hypothetical protein MZV64_27155 [Ignavibacteriales bacterium]|nr:hypothetical protein [Ignavibacteriales bacterium]